MARWEEEVSQKFPNELTYTICSWVDQIQYISVLDVGGRILEAEDDDAELGNATEETTVEAKAGSTAGSVNECPAADLPIGTFERPGVETNHVESPVNEVAKVEDWESHPFWLLLKRACYEKW